MKTILIITGGYLDYEWASEFIANKKYHYIIAVDSGYKHLTKLGLTLNVIVGDFDSLDENIFNNIDKSLVETYPTEKDYTDTELALLKAIDMSPDKIEIIGATGSRADHFMTSIMNLKVCLDSGIKAAIYDKNNKIYLLKGKCDLYTTEADTDGIARIKTSVENVEENINIVKIRRNEQYGEFVSLIPLTDINVSLDGFKYPLNRRNVPFGETLCQSNEIQNDVGIITLHKGVAVVCESKD